MISHAPCHFKNLICDYLDGTIDDHSAAAFEGHLDHCTECITLLRENHADTEPETWLQLLQNPFPGVELQSSANSSHDNVGAEQAASVFSESPNNAEQLPSGSSQSPPAVGLRYTSMRRLGSGGCGEVWEAWDQLLCRPVALKFLKNTLAPLAETHRFMQEATALARLSHPHIVGIYELQNHAGSLALVMELVSGPSLAHYLHGRPCPPIAAAVLLEQLCHGIEHAHTLGVIHRDLKPSNILLKPTSSALPAATHAFPELGHWLPKIADFGLAHIAGQPTLTLPGQQFGTPSYMAPEQISANPSKSGPATDIYGLGAILYEILTGRPPFTSSDPALTMAMILRSDPVPPGSLVQGIPKDLETICLKCLRKEPKHRYANVAALRQDCLAFLQNRPISARPIGRPTRIVAWSRRHPAEFTAIIACICLLVAVTAGSLRTAHLSEKLSAEAREKVRLLEQTQTLQQQQQESVHAKFDQLLRAHYHFLQWVEDSRRPQPVTAEAMRTEILRSASEIGAPYTELLDQRIAAGQRLTPDEVRLAIDYLDLAFKAGASVDFDNRLLTLQKLVQNLPPDSAPPRELLETQIRLHTLEARLAAVRNQHVRAGQFHENIADLIDQQLITFNCDDPARVERLYMKTAMLLNATFDYIRGNQQELGLNAVIRAEETTTTLINADPDNQSWLALLLEVRLRKSEFLPKVDAAQLASTTLHEFQNTLWKSPQVAEKVRQIQSRLQALAQNAIP